MIKFILKFSFALLLLYWLFQADKIDFDLLQQSFNYPLQWALCLGILFLNVLLSTYRWKLIVETQLGEPEPYVSFLKFQWIGLLFNTVLPGAVSGDIIKLIYARNLDPKLSKTFLVTTVALDRIIGLSGLIFILGFSSILYYQELILISNEIETMIHFNFVLTLLCFLFFITLFLPKKIQEMALKFSEKIPLLGKHIHKTLSQIWSIGSNKIVVLKTLSISICTQGAGLVAFWILASPFFGTDIPLHYGFTFIPIGFISVAIPITPAGLGIGHAIFDKLFSFFSVNNGANLFNFYFLSNIFINLIGLIPYLTHSKRYSMDDLEKFESTN